MFFRKSFFIRWSEISRDAKKKNALFTLSLEKEKMLLE